MASFYPMRLAPDPVSVTMPTVLRRDRGGADDRSALAVLKRRQGQHAGRRFGDAAEGTNQVHLDHALEAVERVMPDLAGLAVATGGPEGAADAGAIDQDPLLPDQPAGPRETGIPLAKLGIEIEQRDLGAVRGEPPRGRGTEAGRPTCDDSSDWVVQLHRR